MEVLKSRFIMLTNPCHQEPCIQQSPNPFNKLQTQSVIILPYPPDPEEAARVGKNILNTGRDIIYLSIEAYRWIILRTCFIAHDELEGYIEKYQNRQNLYDNILANHIHNT
jgi:hypothetical protein